MEEFILIFRHENAAGRVSPEQMQIWMQQQMDWINTIASQGKFIDGMGLDFERAGVVSHDKLVTNGPFGEIKETLGGFVLIRAKSLEEAINFAKGAPILQGQGNTVEVRRIIKH